MSAAFTFTRMDAAGGICGCCEAAIKPHESAARDLTTDVLLGVCCGSFMMQAHDELHRTPGIRHPMPHQFTEEEDH